MRKIIVCGVAAALLTGGLPALASCAEKGENSEYTITAEYFPEERKLSARMSFTYYNDTENALDALKFELYPNAYREGAKYRPISSLYETSAYYKGKSYGEIEIASVEGGASYEVTGEDENILSVALSAPVYPEERVQLHMSFTTTLAEVNHRLGVGEHAVNLANFYPVLCAYGENGFLEYVYSSNGDPFVTDCADYDVTLTVPQSYTVVYGGEGKKVTENEKNTYHVMSENARDCAFVLGENFNVATGAAGNIQIEYYYLGDQVPEAGLRAATESIAFYGRTFGKYAYSSYALVQTDLCAGGMEYPALSMIACDLREEEVPRVVAHETAHQWWYAMVGSNQFEHAWQDEGLADYSAALFLEAYPSYGYRRDDLVAQAESSYRAFFSVWSQLHGEGDTTMNRPLSAFSGEYEYGNIAYHKGVILFDRLRACVGDRKFYGGLKEYSEKYRFREAEPQDLIACFHKMGADVEGFFDSFLNGKCVI